MYLLKSFAVHFEGLVDKFLKIMWTVLSEKDFSA